MRYVLFSDSAGRVKPGVIEGSSVRPFGPDIASLEAFIELAPAERKRALAALGAPVPLASVTLRAPVQPKKNVFCVGRNYLAHAQEGARATGKEVRLSEVPAFFTKAPTAVSGPDADLRLFEHVSQKYDWEAELGVVIGKRCLNVAVEDAPAVVFGYTCVNDVSAREVQYAHGGQWFKGKSLDNTCPIGPWIVDTDEIDDPQALEIMLRVNGVEKQHSNTALMIFNVAVPIPPHWQQAIGVAAIAGIVRLVKRTRRIQYPAAAAGFALLLLGYFFPSNERLLLPLYPLVLMGFWTEAKNLWTVVRLAWKRGRPAERILSAAAGTAVAAVAGLIVASYIEGHFEYLPRLRATCQSDRLQSQPAYDWIRSHIAPTATIYAAVDPLLYLYTGRHALGLPAMPARFYQDDASAQAREFPLTILHQARAHHLDYLLITTTDGYMEGLKGRLWDAAARDPKLQKEYATPTIAVYRNLP